MAVQLDKLERDLVEVFNAVKDTKKNGYSNPEVDAEMDILAKAIVVVEHRKRRSPTIGEPATS